MIIFEIVPKAKLGKGFQRWSSTCLWSSLPSLVPRGF